MNSPHLHPRRLFFSQIIIAPSGQDGRWRDTTSLRDVTFAQPPISMAKQVNNVRCRNMFRVYGGTDL